MNEQEALELLSNAGALITDSHVVYTSGKHGNAYINKDAIYPNTRLISRLCRSVAQLFAKKNVEVVIAPAIGGVILSQWIAFHLEDLTNKQTLAVYAEKSEDHGRTFVIRRGYDQLIRGKRVLVAEDVLTTGGSVKKVIHAVRAAGGIVVGIGALCNRGDVAFQDIDDPPELISLMNVHFESWDELACELCAKQVPINTTIGKGLEFLHRKNGVHDL